MYCHDCFQPQPASLSHTKGFGGRYRDLAPFGRRGNQGGNNRYGRPAQRW